MKQTKTQHIRDLIERIARINAAEEWFDDLSPTQLAVLSYLVRANRFSRSPSHVAEFLVTTRGTVSQTLQVLARKGMIEKIPSQTDRRWASYEATKVGLSALDHATIIDETLEKMDSQTREVLTNALGTLVRNALNARDRRSFGLCKTCRYYRPKKHGGFCTLLSEELIPEDGLKICHEHQMIAS